MTHTNRSPINPVRFTLRFLYDIGALDLQKMRALFETNVFGLVDITNRVVPQMKSRRSGDIVNIASTSGMKGAASSTPYGGSKWAVRGITQCWQAELRPHGEPPPVFIVVCPNTTVSRLVYEWIAGRETGDPWLAPASTSDGTASGSPRSAASPTWCAASTQPNTGVNSALKVKFRKFTTPVAVPLISGGFASLITVYGSMAAPEATEEAIYNSLCMADTMTGTNGATIEGLPLNRLKDWIAKHHS